VNYIAIKKLVRIVYLLVKQTKQYEIFVRTETLLKTEVDIEVLLAQVPDRILTQGC